MPTLQINTSAQLAANLENYRSSLDRLGSNIPIVINDNTNIPILIGLYPIKHILTTEVNVSTISSS